jgi:hypothetical protein
LDAVLPSTLQRKVEGRKVRPGPSWRTISLDAQRTPTGRFGRTVVRDALDRLYSAGAAVAVSAPRCSLVVCFDTRDGRKV